MVIWASALRSTPVGYKAKAKKVQKDRERKKRLRGGGGVLRRFKRSHTSPNFTGSLFTGYNK